MTRSSQPPESRVVSPIFIHSFIHTEHLYSASSRELLTGAPDSSAAKKSSFLDSSCGTQQCLQRWYGVCQVALTWENVKNWHVVIKAPACAEVMSHGLVLSYLTLCIGTAC